MVFERSETIRGCGESGIGVHLEPSRPPRRPMSGVLWACCKVVCRPRGNDQRWGRVVLVNQFHTSPVISAVNGQQPREKMLNKRRDTRPAGWKPPAGRVDHCLLCQAAQPISAGPVVVPGSGPLPPATAAASKHSTAKRSKRTKAKQAAEPTLPAKGKGKANCGWGCGWGWPSLWLLRPGCQHQGSLRRHCEAGRVIGRVEGQDEAVALRATFIAAVHHGRLANHLMVLQASSDASSRSASSKGRLSY
ncbi:hypothetical protein HaLaN_27308 [Haematococcus lacustris]|uniref:Uncharacterized protein n=1 Tax=Haematococcus lacustris TaxID=44745 RepID=A0A6A0A847_HAELA|nr:hypothetical protein HaLaN_27308 [Haematococcus lacustris]